jgi:hypothetical protein
VSALTEHDRRRITEARELAALVTPAAVRERFPGWGDDLLPAYVEAFTSVRYVLADVAALAERIADSTQEGDAP